MIANYFVQFEQTIEDFSIVQKQTIEKLRKDDEFGILKGILYFGEESLEFIEVVRIISGKYIKAKYKYHFMDYNKKMIFRYDNVKHHHQIKTFPHHKHLPEKIIPSQEPDIFSILKEIQEYLKLRPA